MKTLDILFSADVGKDLIFKGGTSLSKAYGVIHRFSEDIDITVNINRLLPDKTADSEFPPTKSQAKKWKKRIDEDELPRLIDSEITPQLMASFPGDVVVTREGTIVYIDYTALAVGRETRSSGAQPYIRTVVKIDFGGASSGEPNHETEISSDVAGMADVGGIELPRARVRVMNIQRTFWEKATLAHVACVKGRNNWKSFARHWHDLVQIYKSEYWSDCLNDLEAAKLVAVVKKHFYPESPVDYEEIVLRGIQIVPDGNNFESLRLDYHNMIESGMLERTVESFDELMAKCDEIANVLNSRNLD